MSLVSFGSDNHSGVHPLLLQAMTEVNTGYAPSYEQDSWSQELKSILQTTFDAVDSALVFNGTAANVICLQLALKSYQSVLCADNSHLHVDECGAPEKIAGVKLITLPTQDGKIIVDEIEKHIIRRGDQHHSQVKMVSITQPTEYGTVYSFSELKQIAEICKKYELYMHMDGARLANAAATLQCSLKDLVQDVDVLSFGGAKNGLMLGEFVVVRNTKLSEGLRFYRKQSLQLPAKTRFLAAPFLKYLENQFWLELAQQENQRAQILYEGLKEIPGVTITRPRQANSVFAILPKEWIKPLRKKYFFYVWDESSFEVRLMTSFSTTTDEIQQFLNEIQELAHRKDPI